MTNANETKKKYLQYIEDSFDLEYLETPETSTRKEKARAFLAMVEKCKMKNNLVGYIQGLGGGLDIEFWNEDILNTAKEFGLLSNILSNSRFSKMKNKELAKERAEEQIVENYWKVMASYIQQMAR